MLLLLSALELKVEIEVDPSCAVPALTTIRRPISKFVRQVMSANTLLRAWV
jgi:hypothetical protein